MHEQPPQEPDQQPGASDGLWDPDEQVGDIYEIEIGPQGQIEHAERLRDETSDDDPDQAEQAPGQQPRIWVGSWLDYNNGVLHGDWLDVARDDAEIEADIQAMLARSPTAAQTGEPAEEWGIFDHEHFSGLQIDANESMAWVAKVARGISQHGPAFAAWAAMVEDESLLDGFTSVYLGHYDSVQDYAEQTYGGLDFEQLLDRHVPPYLRPHVHLNTESLARDLRFGGQLYVLPAAGGGVWLFDNTR